MRKREEEEKPMIGRAEKDREYSLEEREKKQEKESYYEDHYSSFSQSFIRGVVIIKHIL